MPFTPKAAVKEVQDISLLAGKAFGFIVPPSVLLPGHPGADGTIGVGSVAVVMLTGFFTGSVLTLQTAKTLSTFGAKGFTGSTGGDFSGPGTWVPCLRP